MLTAEGRSRFRGDEITDGKVNADSLRDHKVETFALGLLMVGGESSDEGVAEDIGTQVFARTVLAHSRDR